MAKPMQDVQMALPVPPTLKLRKLVYQILTNRDYFMAHAFYGSTGHDAVVIAKDVMIRVHEDGTMRVCTRDPWIIVPTMEGECLAD